ncbi:HAD family hydrolase [Psychroflexus aestuariivivens]|uniref:HAD family hydrolase n=1 Tax=Psychroflexus aestuariivivens TaxID=1795040 RepID=UPI000FDCC64D|nr:HAD family phosphatase [Psychroflexus aestuariivivens]
MIKNIIFDFGDVFLTLDKSATQKQLQKFGIQDFDESMIANNEAYEKGEISSEKFVDFYVEKFEGLSKNEFTKAWNSILIEFPESRLDFLKELKISGQYKLILLSNTNELHIDWVKENISVFEEFRACFDKFYLSHEIHFRKPNANIFEFVLRENNLNPNEALFVDDTEIHTKTARKLGIHTWHLQAGKEDVTDLFSIKKDLF